MAFHNESYQLVCRQQSQTSSIIELVKQKKRDKK